ncbi:MAG: helix-turn-helix transcriptional regulator [Bacteroidetes bacterium]|nr:helix-turn-helix transcriptional regulator [Bacteroidota bacterium]
MAHIAIFLYIISLGIGVASILNCKRILNDQHISFLKSFLTFIILFNIYLLVDFTALYLSINLSTQIIPGNLILIWILIGWLSFFTLSGSIWFYLQLILNLLSMKNSRFFSLTFIVLAIGFIIAFINGIVAYIMHDTVIIYKYTIPAFKYTLLSFGILLTALLVFESKNINILKKREVLSTFGWVFMVLLSGMIVIYIIRSKTTVLMLSVISLSVNLIVLYGMKPFIKRFYGSYPTSINNSLSIDHISEQFNISIREKQVFELIIKGKSNKEIEQELLISSHTVKNHIYSIFRKVGVQSRSQLINRVLGNF